MEKAECAKPENRQSRSKGQHDLWFYDKEESLPEDISLGQIICMYCPVFDKCRDYQKRIGVYEGTWAARVY